MRENSAPPANPEPCLVQVLCLESSHGSGGREGSGSERKPEALLQRTDCSVLGKGLGGLSDRALDSRIHDGSCKGPGERRAR